MTKEATAQKASDFSRPGISRAEQYIETAKNNAATNAGRKFFHLGKQEEYSTSALNILGEGVVVSNKLYLTIFSQFDWYSLPSITSPQIKLAAIAAQLTVYDSAHKPPYVEINLEEDEYILVLFGTEKKTPVKKHFWGNLAKAFSGTLHPALEYEYSALRFPDKLVPTPVISAIIPEGNRGNISFPICGFEDTIAVDKDSYTVSDQLLRHLQYRVPTMELGDAISAVPLEACPDKELAHYTYLQDRMPFTEPVIYFLQSEIEERG